VAHDAPELAEDKRIDAARYGDTILISLPVT
jgi:hypothetical protein